ncbi:MULTISPECIES: 5-(carboxyamino)imidazole ribonucleotide synthase [Sphingobacterium]|jgi:5-(carboxyamino)imidazole ribonucleotide synthase|uniref:N5-carboxyaminoimidazole ribonucleotide synthase n=2 Tax=Sphingobacterium TaxID=28453 RepID=A0ABW5YUX8_9SPHI|nr:MULTISPECIES: 5-(carboxyamino)imidazole ribonucleotide synthase [unclassified Sphingobacterium]MBB2952753.1 5-(carboxyamino)imidazole ribonucleotide synthase [Sphingobacterium sp. JUb56]MCS3555575.1 5-(carboxyamino)imidazole ribonucleotide synthase [Sphingobacterium sp. JUb21]NJI76009.1 5-(carboxyamino)imidazole ribonucleotide synthase [Sphingobacterium sp. B16(2022)]QQD14521.1 5-(carboxyamino)imidazole ribonucleotide synthase [Sphingobacterium sp. UDSM-2020]TCR02273.1 5-(carboxyamino)imida
MGKDFYGDLQLGVLGGGQLGRMLIQEAINYNVNVHILDPDKNAPCRKLCNRFECGSLSDFETVYNFGKDLDMITIEIEKVNVDALEKLEEEGVLVYPQSRIIRLIQDKGLQKQFFKQNDIPTSAFQLISTKENLKNTNLTIPYIQKLRKDGYDGKGVKKINTVDDLETAFDEPSLIEEWVDFEKEIAVIVARNDDGDVATFPMVEMEFNPEANLVEFLIAPSTYGFDIQQRAEELAKKIANDLQIVGLLAVEMFLTKDGEILVNELAPRTHNSGHQTIEGNYVSQFAQHLRAIFNLPLGDTRCRTNAVMINLLGEEGYEGLAKYEGVEEILAMEGVYVHLYGKKFTKPFRKMGHVCIINDDRELAISNARKVQEILKVKA